MHILKKIAARASQLVALIGAIALIFMLVHVAADVLLRNTLQTPIPATNEIVSRYYMVLIAFLPIAYVENTRSMVSVEVIEGMLGKALLKVSDLFVLMITVPVYACLTWVTFIAAIQNWEIGSFVDVQGIQIPIWPSYFLPAFGFLLALIISFIRVISIFHWEDANER